MVNIARRNRVNKMSKQEKNVCERCGKEGCKCNMFVELGTGILLILLGALLWFETLTLNTVFGFVLVLWGVKKLLCCRRR